MSEIPVIRNQPYKCPEVSEFPGRLLAASVLFKGHLWTAKRHFMCRDNMIKDLKAGENEKGMAIDADGDVIYMCSDSQGFYCENGRHVSRAQGEAIAYDTGQLDLDVGIIGGELTSEDLWK